jgi:hypothetical protein
MLGPTRRRSVGHGPASRADGHRSSRGTPLEVQMKIERARAHRVAFVAGVMAAAALFAGFAGHAARSFDPGVDEVPHLGAAVHLEITGSNQLNAEHPPLTKKLAGLGLWLAGYVAAAEPIAIDEDQWHYGRRLLFRNDAIDRSLLLAARVPFVLLGVFGVLAVAACAASVHGRAAACFAALICAFSPTMHAHSAMVETDLGLGVFALGAMGLGRSAWNRGSMARAAAAGACAAAAAMTKFTGLLVMPLLLALLAIEALRRRRLVPGTSTSGALQLGTAAALGSAAGVLAIEALCGWPGGYLDGLARVGHNHPEEWQYYAMGRFSATGFWYFFPLTMALKSTPVEIGALLLAGLLTLRPILRGEARAHPMTLDGAWLLAFPLAYLLALGLFAPNLSHRYTVPLYPFLFVVMAGALVHARRALIGVLLVAGQALLAIGARADPLGYFNGLAGCSRAGAAFCLDDASLDWGQSRHRIWPAIAGRLAPTEKPIVMLWGEGPIAAFVPRHELFRYEDWLRPRPALYVLSGHVVVRWWAAMPDLPATPLFRALPYAESIGTTYFLLDLRFTPPATTRRAPGGA